MKKKQIDLVQFTPEMNEEQILDKLEQHLLKQGWTIIEDLLSNVQNHISSNGTLSNSKTFTSIEDEKNKEKEKDNG